MVDEFKKFLDEMKQFDQPLVEAVESGFCYIFESDTTKYWNVKRIEGDTPLITDIPPEERELSNCPKFATG